MFFEWFFNAKFAIYNDLSPMLALQFATMLEWFFNAKFAMLNLQFTMIFY